MTLLALPAAASAQAPADPAALRLKEVVDDAVAAAQPTSDPKPAPGKPQKSEVRTPAPPTAQERAARGVVLLLRGAKQVALGTVLAGDGRILTALSPLGNGNDLDARFPDGSLVRVKLGHHDRAWDLALLVPQTSKWQHGLVASSQDPVRPDVQVQAFTVQKGRPSPSPIVLRAHRRLLGGDEAPLDDAIELGSRVAPTDLGGPIVDPQGQVVALLGRGCAPNDGKPCTSVAFGAPMAAIRAFLRAVPATAVAPAPWLGIQGASESGAIAKGVRVLSVHPKSPAEQAGLRGDNGDAEGDVILAIAGTPVTSPEALATAIRSRGVGDSVPIVVLSRGMYRTVTVVLRAAPESSRVPPADSAAGAHPSALPPLGQE
jgi:serine protease Do